MTEKKWQASTDAVEMRAHLSRPQGDRRLRLFTVACARKLWDLLISPASRDAVECAERFADGFVVGDDEWERLSWRSEGAVYAAERIAREEALAERLGDDEDAGAASRAQQ